MELALVVPEPSPQLTLAQLETVEQAVARAVPEMDDIHELAQWRNQVNGLARYIKRNDLRPPVLGAQRRIEARLGELLPELPRGRPAPDEVADLVRQFDPSERAQFRVLARGANSLSEEEWRQGRQPLATLIRRRLGGPAFRSGAFAGTGARQLIKTVAQVGESARLARSMHNLIGGMNDDQRREARETIEQAMFDLGGLLGALDE